MWNEDEELAPPKRGLFPLTADDIVDNALQNLDEKQAREVTQKAADEVVRLAVEKRKAQYRGDAAHEEMRHLIENANLLDGRGGDYKIKSTFETATGTTEVEIQKSRLPRAVLLVTILVLLVLSALAILLMRH